MHPISDKELDELFQKRLHEADYQPSADVWNKISEELGHKRPVWRRYPVARVAASLIMITAAAFWFYRPVERIQLQGTPNQQAQVEPSESRAGINVSAKAFAEPPARTVRVESRTMVKPEPVQADPPREEPEPVMAEATRIAATTSLSKVETNQPEVLLQLSPDEDLTAEPFDAMPDRSAMQASAGFIPDEGDEINSSKRIKSIGGLVNFVISKVDHRDDKLIEFVDGEEGTEIAGINLGLLKLKNRNKIDIQ
jgi:hypothetical protein